MIVANKTEHPTDIKTFKEQQNIVMKLHNKIKRSYMNSLNPKKGSKPFWDKCKPYFLIKIMEMRFTFFIS